MARLTNSNACCLNPKTKIAVDRVKLIAAIERAKKKYVEEHEQKIVAHAKEMEKFEKEYADFWKRFRAYCESRLKAKEGHRLNTKSFYGRNRGAGVDVEELFCNAPVPPNPPRDAPTKEQLFRAMLSYDTAIAQLRMSPKDTVNVSMDDYRLYMERC